MEECLAIKPDLIFLWDEAWFAFARFGPTYRQRTAMNAANVLRERFKSDAHAAAYESSRKSLKGADDENTAEHASDPATELSCAFMQRNRRTRR